MRTVEKEILRDLRLGGVNVLSVGIVGDSRPTNCWEQIVSHQSKTGLYMSNYNSRLPLGCQAKPEVMEQGPEFLFHLASS